MNRQAWQAVGRYWKVKTSFKDYLGMWIGLIAVAVGSIIFIGVGSINKDQSTVSAIVSLYLAITVVVFPVSLTASGYQDVVTGKRMRLRLLPNGYFIYGAVTFLSVVVFSLSIVVLACGLFVLFHPESYLWAAKTLLVVTTLLLAVMPWAMLLSAAVKGIGSFMATFVIFIILATFIAPMTLGNIEVSFPFNGLKGLYYPLKVMLKWCTGSSLYAVAPSASPAIAFGITLCVGAIGYVMMAAFYRRILGNPSITATARVQRDLVKTASYGKGW